MPHLARAPPTREAELVAHRDRGLEVPGGHRGVERAASSGSASSWLFLMPSAFHIGGASRRSHDDSPDLLLK